VVRWPRLIVLLPIGSCLLQICHHAEPGGDCVAGRVRRSRERSLPALFPQVSIGPVSVSLALYCSAFASANIHRLCAYSMDDRASVIDGSSVDKGSDDYKVLDQCTI
jgi:hypothetical protein